MQSAIVTPYPGHQGPILGLSLSPLVKLVQCQVQPRDAQQHHSPWVHAKSTLPPSLTSALLFSIPHISLAF